MAGTAAPWREAHEERDGHRHGRERCEALGMDLHRGAGVGPRPRGWRAHPAPSSLAKRPGHPQESPATVKGPMLTGGEVRCPK